MQIPNYPLKPNPANDDIILGHDVDGEKTAIFTREGLLTGSPLPNNIVTKSVIASGSVDSTKVDWTATGGIWWEEVGRAKLNSAATTLSVTGLPQRRKYRVLINATAGVAGSGFFVLRANNDSGASAYTQRQIRLTTTTVSALTGNTNSITGGDTTGLGQNFIVDLIVNQMATATNPKTMTLTASSDLDMRTGLSVYNGTSFITSFDLSHSITNGIGSQSEIIVLAHN